MAQKIEVPSENWSGFFCTCVSPPPQHNDFLNKQRKIPPRAGLAQHHSIPHSQKNPSPPLSSPNRMGSDGIRLEFSRQQRLLSLWWPLQSRASGWRCLSMAHFWKRAGLDRKRWLWRCNRRQDNWASSNHSWRTQWIWQLKPTNKKMEFQNPPLIQSALWSKATIFLFKK